MRLKELPFVAQVRGEKGGMVWGVEMRDHAGQPAADWASTSSSWRCYRGEGQHAGIHLLGPLAKKVVRIAPPLVISEAEAHQSMELMYRVLAACTAQVEIRFGVRVALNGAPPGALNELKERTRLRMLDHPAKWLDYWSST